MWKKKKKESKANLRDLIAATGLIIFLKLDSSHRFSAVVTSKFDGWPQTKIGHLFYTNSSSLHHFKSIGTFKLDLQSRNIQYGSKSAIIYPVWPRNLMEDIEKQWGTFSILHQAFCTISKPWVNSNWDYSLKTSNLGQNQRLSRVTLKFNGLPWKTIGHLFHVASSFVHHFIAINEIKLELQSGNARLGQNRCFCPVWPWNLTDD